jgi:hypothetical protein
MISTLRFSLAAFTTFAITTTTTAAFADPVQSERDALKTEILAIAKANTFDTPETLPVTRAALEPLVERLVSLAGSDDVLTQLRKVEGSWYELWSDDREPEKPGSRLRRDSIYQVVTGAGFFYNIGTSESTLPVGPTPGATYTSFLRGVYTLNAAKNGFEIEFTNLGFIDGWLDAGSNLVDTIYRAESDASFLKAFPFPVKAPRGPIGQRGFLTNVYLDANLRIARGEGYADGRQDLYVLEKVSAPVVTE